MEFHVQILYSLCRKEFYAYLKYRVFEYQTRGLSCLDVSIEQGHQYSLSWDLVWPRGKENNNKIFSVINTTLVWPFVIVLLIYCSSWFISNCVRRKWDLLSPLVFFKTALQVRGSTMVSPVIIYFQSYEREKNEISWQNICLLSICDALRCLAMPVGNASWKIMMSIWKPAILHLIFLFSRLSCFLLFLNYSGIDPSSKLRY